MKLELNYKALAKIAAVCTVINIVAICYYFDKQNAFGLFMNCALCIINGLIFLWCVMEKLEDKNKPNR